MTTKNIGGARPGSGRPKKLHLQAGKFAQEALAALSSVAGNDAAPHSDRVHAATTILNVCASNHDNTIAVSSTSVQNLFEVLQSGPCHALATMIKQSLADHHISKSQELILAAGVLVAEDRGPFSAERVANILAEFLPMITKPAASAQQ